MDQTEVLAHISSAFKELEELRQAIEQATLERRDRQCEAYELRRQVERLSKAHDDLAEEKDGLKAELVHTLLEHQLTVGTMEERIQHLEGEKARLEQERAQIEQEKALFEEEAAQLEQEKASLLEQQCKLADQLEEAKRQNIEPGVIKERVVAAIHKLADALERKIPEIPETLEHRDGPEEIKA